MRATALALLAVAVLAGGCLKPHRVVVPVDALEASPHDWTEVRYPTESEGWLGPKTKETRYSFQPAGNGPPFPGVLQVFSLREASRRTTDELLELARDVLQDSLADQNITLDDGGGAEGRRTLQGGVRTAWFTREGVTTGEGDVFRRDDQVRIVVEVGHDGISKTSFVAVGFAQVGDTLDCPIIGPCQTQSDASTWTDVVGDPEGSIGGARSNNGFLDHLVTR